MSARAPRCYQLCGDFDVSVGRAALGLGLVYNRGATAAHQTFNHVAITGQLLVITIPRVSAGDDHAKDFDEEH